MVVLFWVKRPTNKLVKETGPRFIVSAERLGEWRIEPATLELQGQHSSHGATTSPVKQQWLVLQETFTQTLSR